MSEHIIHSYDLNVCAYPGCSKKLSPADKASNYNNGLTEKTGYFCKDHAYVKILNGNLPLKTVKLTRNLCGSTHNTHTTSRAYRHSFTIPQVVVDSLGLQKGELFDVTLEGDRLIYTRHRRSVKGGL